MVVIDKKEMTERYEKEAISYDNKNNFSEHDC